MAYNQPKQTMYNGMGGGVASTATALQAAANGAVQGVAQGAALATQNQTATTAKKSSGAASPTAATNPYASQIAAAQSALNSGTKPTYTAPTATKTVLPTYTDSYAQRISDLEAQGAGTYTSQYQPLIDQTLEKLQNRKFQYNMSEDPLYRQYAAQYTLKGQQAMKDTMGQAAALTGGYGSSYAATAGSQAYQQYLNELNDKALDLYSLARQSYDSDGSDMRSNLSALQTAESMNRSNFENDRADYYNRLAALREGQSTEYQRYQDALGQYNTDRQYQSDTEQAAWNRYMDEQSIYNQEQQRAWDQYVYWNNLWENRRS